MITNSCVNSIKQLMEIQMSTNRDDFSEKTKDILAKRVTCICSNPDCRKRTMGPNSDPNKSSNIGIAAHICAAAPGGKRYDVNMTPEERADIKNGIWLCQDCAHLIDTDEKKYSVSLLHQWKDLAESIAEKAISSNGQLVNDIFSISISTDLDLELEINKDSDYTVLTKKLKDGEFDDVSIFNAKDAKIYALSIIKKLKVTESGRSFLNDIYNEVKMTILNKYYFNKTEGALVRLESSRIMDDLNKIVDKYNDRCRVNIKFVMGLLFIATSNCAMKWKYGDAVCK